MSKYDIRPILNFKIGFWMSKYNIRPKFECQNRILNVKILYSASVQMAKYDTRRDFKCQKMKTKK